MKDLLKRSDHTIPIGVRYWAFYKRYVLENHAILERCNGIETKQDFVNLVRPFLKNAPVRGHKAATSERLVRDMMCVLFEYHKTLFSSENRWRPRMTERGLGLVATQRFVWDDECAKKLFGCVAALSVEDFEALRAKKYPSLFSSRNSGPGVLFGPACLVNHACDGEFRWSSPTKRGLPEEFQGFFGVRLKKRRPTIVFEEGKELCVVYGMRSKDFECGCRRCKDL